MPALLLPDTAAPFAPRSPPTVVLDTVVNPWLTTTLKRINRLKRPLNSVPQHLKCLTETLSSASAIWNLCSIMVPRAPELQIPRHSNPLVDALSRYQFIHVQAYVVHIDLVLSHEIAFKLTPEAIASLVDYHKDIYLVDVAAGTWPWTEKEAAVKKLHEEFVQTVNKYVFRTDKIALEGIEDDGAGELLCGQSEEVKNAIMGFFIPLLPPPPRVVDIRPPLTPMLPSSPGSSNWWSPTPPVNTQVTPVDAWKVLPSTPITSAPSSTSATSTWGDLQGSGSGSEVSSSGHGGYATSSAAQQPSTTASSSSWWNPPPSSSPQSHHQPLPFQPTSGNLIPQLPLPSALAQPCSTAMGYGGFGWDTGRISDYATTM